MLVCYCWCYCGLIQPADCGNPDAKRLYDDLLSNYNKIVRPVVNNSDVLTVRIKLKLSQLIDLASVIFHPLHLFSFRHLSSHLIAAANSISYHFTNSLSIQLLNSWVGGGRRPGNQFSVTHFWGFWQWRENRWLSSSFLIRIYLFLFFSIFSYSPTALSRRLIITGSAE